MFGIDVPHPYSWVGTHLVEPVDVDAMSTWQMSQCHTASLFDQLDDSLIVLRNDEYCRLLRPSGVREVLGGIEELGVGVELTGLWNGRVRFRGLGRGRAEEFRDGLPEGENL